jgi:hypothetical protein
MTGHRVSRALRPEDRNIGRADGPFRRARPDEVMWMTEIMLIGLAAVVLVVVVAGLLDRLLDFDDLTSSSDS